MPKNSYEINRIPISYGEYMEFDRVDRHYSFVKKHLAKKIASGERLRVAFFVLFDSIFQSKSLYKAMLEDDIFDPFIVIIPDTRYDIAHLLEKMDMNYASLSQEFKKVYKSYTEETGFIDFANEVDLICFNNLYESFTHEPYTMQYALKTKALPFVMSYALCLSQYFINRVVNLASYNGAWKNFVDTKENLLEFKTFSLAKARNAVLTGYGKMDELALYKKHSRARKKIILAPHHTIKEVAGNYAFSNFIKYASFFLELPKKYPEIDFVFRPHPALFERLNHVDFWTKQEIDAYLSKISSLSNMQYQGGGDYFEAFANSDALIHDCNSFLGEYLYTDNPACFMIKDEGVFSHFGTKLGKACLEQHELAYNQEDIISFIENTVIKGIDTKKEKRLAFCKKHLKINYPHASNIILEHIKSELK